MNPVSSQAESTNATSDGTGMTEWEQPVGRDVDAILSELHDGLREAEETMASILKNIVADNEIVLTELEDALTDMEAALAKE